MKRQMLLFALFSIFALPRAVSQTETSALASPPIVAASAPTAVPPLVPYAGLALDPQGKPLPGPASITFLVCTDETGGEPLFTETQTVALDTTGHYKVQLGATLANGLPQNLFSTGEARWLEVQIAGQPPQPRVLIASVPYALKAADAATLGGLPASAYALAGTANLKSATAAAVTSNAALDVTTTGGTAGYVPEFNGTATIFDSPVFVLGSDVGIGTTTPTATLDVKGTALLTGLLTANGGATIGGTLSLPATGTATASGGFNSQMLKIYTSGYDSSSKTVVDPRFEWQAVESGNNTASPTATLNLLSSATAAGATNTGFSFNMNGTINFATGQTLPGADITGTVNSSTGYDLGGQLFATGSTATDSAYLGFAGNTSSTGFLDTGTGYKALASNTAGEGNTASGFDALSLNTTGNYNTASGASALYFNTTGGDNTASGYQALYYNTTGGAQHRQRLPGAIPQHHRRRQHRQRRQCALLQHHRLRQHRQRRHCALLQHHGHPQHRQRLARRSTPTRLGPPTSPAATMRWTTTPRAATTRPPATRRSTTTPRATGTLPAAISALFSNTTGSDNVGVGGNAGATADDSAGTGSNNTAVGSVPSSEQDRSECHSHRRLR